MIANLEFVFGIMGVKTLGPPDRLFVLRVHKAPFDPNHDGLIVFVADHDALHNAFGHPVLLGPKTPPVCRPEDE